MEEKEKVNSSEENVNLSEVETKKGNVFWTKTKSFFYKIWQYLIKTSGGMALGLFATLIIGTIVVQLGKAFNYKPIEQIGQILQALMGVGVAVGVAMTDKELAPLNIIALGAVGALASSINFTSDYQFYFSFLKVGEMRPSNNPLTVYLVVVAAKEISKLILKKKTPVDILLVPLLMVLIGGLFSFGLVIPCQLFINAISSFVETATRYQPLLMGIVISVVMGMALTAPISSVAISVAIKLSGIAAGAACIGCCVQMVGFAVQSIKDNKIGKVLAVGIGTSMLQFQNILKKPLIWLPTIIASAILGPIGTMCFKLECDAVGGGMGTCGLIGPINTILAMEGNPVMAWSGMITLCIVGPIVLVGLIDFVFRKLNWIKDGDLAI